MTATLTEVQLIQRHFAEAARLYGEAVATSPGRTDDHRSSLSEAGGPTARTSRTDKRRSGAGAKGVRAPRAMRHPTAALR